jgi:hypothetical protein
LISLVKVTADVYHRHSRAPIANLQASDFEVSDEGQRREIAYFEKDSGPRPSPPVGRERECPQDPSRIAEAAAEALAALQPGDGAAVIAFSKTTAVPQPLSADFRGVAKGIRAAMSIHFGTDTDINQAAWSATDYLYSVGGTPRRAILILTDNMQETLVPDSLVDEQLSDAGVMSDGLLFRGAVALPHLSSRAIQAAKSSKAATPRAASGR